MGQNLTRLFAEWKQETRSGDLAYDKLEEIFWDHGEALIAALEECSRSAHPVGCDTWEGGGCTCGKWSAQHLLAQLEAEAQP